MRALRKLTESQAKACEEAKHPRCVCRCGGLFHGQSHKRLLSIERETGLPWDVAQHQLVLPFDELRDDDETSVLPLESAWEGGKHASVPPQTPCTVPSLLAW
jgi:hypothetical protein